MGTCLRIIPIGTNGAFTLTGFNTNYLIGLFKSNKKHQEFLFDCGTTAGVALHKLDRDLIEISDIYISHMHLDHVGGLVQAGLRRYSAGLTKPNLYCCTDLAQKIWPQFLKSFLEIALSQDGIISKFNLDDFFNLIEIPRQDTKLDQSFPIAKINCIPVEFSHPNSSNSFGLIIEEKILITADTVFLPNVLESVANRFPIEAIFHHCTFNPGMEKLHATVEQLMSLPEDLRELIILSHYDDSIPEINLMGLELAQAGKIYEF